MPRRSRSIEIYLKPGIAEDDLIHAIWRSASAQGRPQDLFRRLILLGLKASYASGDLPRAAASVLDVSGTPLTQALTKRGRGRPRKVVAPIPSGDDGHGARGGPPGISDIEAMAAEMAIRALREAIPAPPDALSRPTVAATAVEPPSAASVPSQPTEVQRPRLGRLM